MLEVDDLWKIRISQKCLRRPTLVELHVHGRARFRVFSF